MKQLQLPKSIFSIVIPTYNRKNLLKKCLQTLLTQTYPKNEYEILICDDGSTDDTQKFVKNLIIKQKNLYYLRQKNQGPATARNLGIKNASGRIVAFTDDDCLPAKDWLEQIDKTFELNPNALGVEGKTTSDKQKTRLMTYTVTNETGGNYWTCNIAYQRKALVDVGGFDEEFRFSHCEDIDLSRKILKKGKIIFSPEAIVVHPSRKVGLLSELKKLSHLEDEFKLYLKHRDCFSQFFPVKNEIGVFFLMTFGNHIWYRFRLLKDSLKQFSKNPFVWIKFLCKDILEMIYVILVFPRAVWQAKKWQK